MIESLFVGEAQMQSRYRISSYRFVSLTPARYIGGKNAATASLLCYLKLRGLSKLHVKGIRISASHD